VKAVLAHLCKGGEHDDFDIYIPRPWIHGNDSGQGKVKPPLWQVTVSLI